MRPSLQAVTTHRHNGLMRWHVYANFACVSHRVIASNIVIGLSRKLRIFAAACIGRNVQNGIGVIMVFVLR